MIYFIALCLINIIINIYTFRFYNFWRILWQTVKTFMHKFYFLQIRTSKRGKIILLDKILRCKYIEFYIMWIYNVNHMYFICFVSRQVKELSAENNKAKTNGKTCKRLGKIKGSKISQVWWVYIDIWLLWIGFHLSEKPHGNFEQYTELQEANPYEDLHAYTN